MTQLVLSNSLQSYLVQVNRFSLLSAEEEFELAVRLKNYNDINAAHRLITSNLRFVVKIAMEYRNYGMRLADLVQEGNIGLMKGVRRFDPHKGYRLITYAVWWIRSHIQAFILKNWSLVNRGINTLKKRLFYQLQKSDTNILHLEKYGSQATPDACPEQSRRVGDMDSIADVECRDLSLDNRLQSGGSEEETTYLDMLPDMSRNHEDSIADAQEQRILTAQVSKALKHLNEKERYVIENRVMADMPVTLQEIGDRLGITRERVRQIELEAVNKLKRIKGLQMLAVPCRL